MTTNDSVWQVHKHLMASTEVGLSREATQKMKEIASNGQTVPFYLKPDFCRDASSIRAKFERTLSGTADGQNGGLTPFTYVFQRERYQLLSASSEHILGPDLLNAFLTDLRNWASSVLGISHISTPQVRIYIRGCKRALLRDAIGATWHYVLWLAHEHPRKQAQLKLVTQDFPDDNHRDGIRVGQYRLFTMGFNQLLVHRSAFPYGIEPERPSMDPIDAAAYLDGYLW